MHLSKARADTFEVTNLSDNDAGSLRQAITDANANPDADVITFHSGLSGAITLTTGQLELRESVEIQGPGSEVLAIDGNHASRVFYLYNKAAAIDVTISGLTITGGTDLRGAGIINWGEHLTLDSVEISGNVATGVPQGSFGGGIWGRGTDLALTVKASVISGNSGTGRGGGIHVGNLVQSVLIQDTKISGNQATLGAGGIDLQLYTGNSVTIERSTISGNTTSGVGGGIYLYAYPGTQSIDIHQSTIADNSAENGGGLALYSQGDAITLQNCTISGNQATAGNGGGIYLGRATSGLHLENATVSDNTASGSGGGVHAERDLVTLDNSIIADNTAPTNADISNNTGSFTANYCLIETPGTAALTGANNTTGQDPQLGALADNGGPTETQRPAFASPAINAGDPVFASPPSEDQRGNARVVGGRVDMGAVEVNAGTLQCSMTNISVGEDADIVMLTVTRVGGADGPASVDIATADGTAMEPGDYTDSMATLQWADNDMTPKALTVPINDDELPESSETFTAALSNASGAALGATTSVTVTIDDDDAVPTISAIADQTIDEDEATAAIEFTIDDADDAESGLTVSATSSNHALVADSEIELGGSGAARTVKVTPNADSTGDTDITITVSDGANMAVETFKVTVVAVDDAPTISAIDDVKIDENESTDAIKFTIGDVDSDLADLEVSAKSSKQSLVADDDITLGGKGAKRTVKVKPLADKTGKVDVTITVSDGTKSSKTSFSVTVGAVVDEPTPDAGMMEPSDAGTSMGSGGSGSAGEDASTGASGGEDASTAGDVDGGEADAGQARLGGGGNDCGCSAVGASKRPSAAVIGTVLGLLGMASRRRRRTPGCPRCS